MLIYKITITDINKVYIGQTKLDVEKRLKQHIYSAKNGSKTIFHKCLKNHLDFVKIEILEDGIESKEVLNEREIFYIEKYNSTDLRFGLNQTKGGTGGDTRSGMKNSAEQKLKTSLAQKGKPKKNKGQCGKYKKSEKQKKKISEKIKNKRWVTNLELNKIKYINASDLEDYLKNGWIRGRKIK